MRDRCPSVVDDHFVNEVLVDDRIGDGVLVDDRIGDVALVVVDEEHN